MDVLTTPHGDLPLPAFMPDATRGVVRAAEAADLEAVGIRALMVNSLHLAHRPGTGVIGALGGLHAFMGWKGPLVTDSGGFQVYSLAAGGSGLATVTDEGFRYRFDRKDDKRMLTPEKCLERQLELGSDVAICLDECTHPKAPAAAQGESVRRTLLWARRSREAWRARLDGRAGPVPRLVAVVQGGADPALRRACAEGLAELGFDGFGFGGWPVAGDGGLVDAVGEVARVLPAGSLKLALGIGRPDNVVAAFRAGYRLFDCALPTRDARHGRLYVFTKPPAEAAAGGEFWATLDLTKERMVRDAAPVEAGCDCPACGRYARGYLAHLLAVGDAAGARLATLHNLRFFARLFAALRGG